MADMTKLRLKKPIQQKLKLIVSTPFWSAGKAAAMLWLQIGDRNVVSTRNGGTKEVGTFSLHIECPWFWTQSVKVVANQKTGLVRLNALFATPTICESICAQESGSFELKFNNNLKLIVSVEANTNPNADE